MTGAAHQEAASPEVTRTLAGFASEVAYEAVPPHVLYVARHCLLDWVAVTLAGTREPLSVMLREQALEEGGREQATLLGFGDRVTAAQAALVNGSVGHALDYDDVLEVMIGHPTVPVMPAVLALAERDGHDGRAVLEAVVAGIETEGRVGRLVGPSHYAKGWHATATIGAFGSAAACARLLGLDRDTTAVALGIAGTQAAGLKSMFGTMCKPLHAGKAAQNGLVAATLAARGFSSRPDVLDCAQGFVDTQTETADPAGALAGLGQSYFLPKALFKYHAACYGTHPSIEAARALRAMDGFAADGVERIEVKVDPSCLKMCNIQVPATGLEAKFSLRYTTALALAGGETGALESYYDENIGVPAVTSLRDKISVEPSETIGNFRSEVVVHMKDGAVLRQRADVSIPAENLDAQWSKLSTKFHALVDPILGRERASEIESLVAGFADQPDVSALMRACTIEP